MADKAPLTILIITRNEEANLEACLRSVHGFADQIIVIDSESSDRTVEIANKYANTVHVLPYDPMWIGPQCFQWGLDNAPIRNDWIFLLEADQTFTPELQDELRVLLQRDDISERAFYVRRIQIFRGRALRHGGYGNKYLLKLFHRAHGRFDTKEWDTRVYVDGTMGKLEHCIIEENKKEDDIVFFMQKLLRYVDGAATEEVTRRRNGMQWNIEPDFFGTPDQRVIALRKLFYKAPLYVRSVLFYGYRFVGQRGFLDGKEGAIFHFFQSLWFHLAWDIRVEELMKRAEREEPRP